MGYKDVLHYLEGVIVDRHELSEFGEAWNASSEVNSTLSDTPVTLYSKSAKLTGLTGGSKAFVAFEKPWRLDDRETIELHLYSDHGFAANELSFVLSDDPALTIVNTEIPIPDIPADAPVKVVLTVDDPEKLNAIRSIGVKCQSNANSSELYIMASIMRSGKYVITIEELNKFEMDDGLNFVLSKIGELTLPENDSLVNAISMAGGAYCWMYLNGQDTSSWDYGSKLSTKNYAIRLLSDAETLCEEYLAGQDISRPKTVKMLGGFAYDNL